MSRAPINCHTDIAISSNGLRFQFVLEEFLETQQQMSLLVDSFSHPDTTMEALDSILSPDFNFPWRLNRTPIVKLSDYCHELSIHSDLDNARKLSELSQRTVDEAYRGWRQIKDNFEVGQKLIVRVPRRVERMGKLIAERWPDFSDDENVIFYLLRRQNDFQQALGPRFFKRSWRDLHGSGSEACVKFLKERYSRRGFDHLVPIIEKYAIDLQEIL